MERAGSQTIPLAIPTELTPRLAAVCQQIQWVVAGPNAPADLLAWLNVLQRDEAAILDDRTCRLLVDELRNLLQMDLVCHMNDAQCRGNLQRVLERACRAA